GRCSHFRGDGGPGGRRSQFRGNGSGRNPRSEPGETLREKILGDEPASGAGPGWSIESLRIARAPATAPGERELGGPLAQHQRALLVLDAPRTVYECSKARGRDVPRAIVHHHAGEATEAPGLSLDLEGVVTRGVR